MRNVTIRRNKSFVGCLVSAKIYVEDLMYGDTKINGISCRKLGELKNGQEDTYQISEDAVKIFVIADKVSKGFCSEFYQLPSGMEPVVLTGKNRFSLTAGNAFRFDNNNDPYALENRKKGKKNGIWVMLIAVIVGAIIGGLIGSGAFDGAPEAKTFTKAGMSITLNDDYKEVSVDNYTVAYDSQKVAVLALKEDFGVFQGFEDYTVEQYAELVLMANNMDHTLKNQGNLCYFEYDFKTDTNVEYHYVTFHYKAGDAFWMIQFATPKNNYEKVQTQIMEWAESVTFPG